MQCLSTSAKTSGDIMDKGTERMYDRGCVAFYGTLSSGCNGAIALLNSAAVITTVIPRLGLSTFISFSFSFGCYYWGRAHMVEVRRQLFGVGSFLYLYVGPRDQTLVTRLAQQALSPL